MFNSLKRVEFYCTMLILVLLAVCPQNFVFCGSTAFAENLDSETWMGDLAVVFEKNLLNPGLSRLALTGTHDSGTYGITGSSSPAKDGNYPQDNVDKYRAIGKDLEIYGGVAVTIGTINILLPWGEALIALGTTTIDFGKWLYDQPVNQVASWAKTQANDLAGQFREGVRYFDLRVEYTGSDYRFVHGLRNDQETVPTALEELADAIRQPQCYGEVVILDFQHLYENDGEMSSDRVRELINLVIPIFKFSNGSSMLVTNDIKELKYFNLTANQKQVVIYLGGGYDSEYNVIFPRDNYHLWSKWPNKQNTSNLYDFLKDDLFDWFAQRYYSYPNCLYVGQAILTENQDMITHGVYHLLHDKIGTAGMDVLYTVKWMSSELQDLYDNLDKYKNAPTGNKEMAGAANKDISNWYYDKSDFFHGLCNIVMVDQYHVFPPYPYHSELSILCWNMNIDRYASSSTTRLSPGSVFAIDSSEVGLDAFTEEPEVFAKVKRTAPDSEYIQTPVTSLYNQDYPASRVFAVWQDSTPILHYPLDEECKEALGPRLARSSMPVFPIGDVYLRYVGSQNTVEEVQLNKSLMLSPPEITAIDVDWPSGWMTIQGRFFGSEIPAVYAEYSYLGPDGASRYGYKECDVNEVLSSNYWDAFHQPGNSCMKIWEDDTVYPDFPKELGYSELTALFPVKGVGPSRSYTGYVLVDSGTGMAAFNTMLFHNVGECISTLKKENCGGLTGRDRAMCVHNQQATCHDLFGVPSAHVKKQTCPLPAAR